MLRRGTFVYWSSSEACSFEKTLIFNDENISADLFSETISQLSGLIVIYTTRQGLLRFYLLRHLHETFALGTRWKKTITCRDRSSCEIPSGPGWSWPSNSTGIHEFTAPHSVPSSSGLEAFRQYFPFVRFQRWSLGRILCETKRSFSREPGCNLYRLFPSGPIFHFNLDGGVREMLQNRGRDQKVFACDSILNGDEGHSLLQAFLEAALQSRGLFYIYSA